MTTDERYTDHEVRIRLLENLFEKINVRFDRIEQKIDLISRWMLVTMIMLFCGIILNMAKLI